MKKITHYFLLLLSITLFSCDKDLMVDTSAKADFDLFFEYLENDYAYRDYHPFTMAELKQSYLPQIENSHSQATLANILLNIELNELKDPHVGINSYEPYNLTSVTANIPLDLETIIPYFGEITYSAYTDYYTSGIVTSNPTIGYLYVRAFNSDIGGTNSLEIEEGVKEIDNIIQELINKGITSMIVDIRSGAGGTNYVPRYIAQRFIDKTAIYMNEYYPKGTTFIKKEWTIEPAGTGFRTGKIALLSNGETASGGEMFLLAMLQRDNIIHIGSNSAGASGNIVDKDLSNGWNFAITNSRTEFPNGDQYFKVGITPVIIVKNDADYGITHFNDKLIEKSIEELQ
jgi:hypothetical protein